MINPGQLFALLGRVVETWQAEIEANIDASVDQSQALREFHAVCEIIRKVKRMETYCQTTDQVGNQRPQKNLLDHSSGESSIEQD